MLAGAGKMGGAMLTGWIAGGLDPKRAIVIDPYVSDEIKALAAKGVRLNPDVKDIGAVAALVLAVKPQMFAEVGPTLRTIAGSSLVVSIMAGTTIAGIAKACGGKVVRAMPNTPAAIGRGITVAVAASDVSPEQRGLTDALLRATGSVGMGRGREPDRCCDGRLRLGAGLCVPAGRRNGPRRHRCGSSA